MICAIQEYGAQSQSDFAEEFSPHLDKMIDVYRGHDRTSGNRGTKGVKEFVRRLVEGKQDIYFHEQRAFANYLDHIPVGLLMLYTQLVSDASREDSKDELVNLLDAFSGSVVAQKMVERRRTCRTYY